ncbi:MBL fold metallo-hydrolase [Amycolatopsis sp. RTGN1]|uniref:MBL fold metallo-hydrolase n=1 Tax=Amycolatopsis ponsaeliensis TaxID=2992142 RepID=UPI00254D6BCB|nr:MBL fold metallo-hydrolase [Amycolatopsis sp. RTGN1]
MPDVDPLLRGQGQSSDQGSIGFCGVYLVHAGARRILFDCGHAGRRRALLRALGDRGLAPRDVDVLVLSHAHWDHVQNADLFADVLIHPAEDLAPQGNPFTPPWTAAVLGGVSVHAAADGLELAPGVTVTSLPGHTAGSIGLTVATAAGTALLTGDAVPSAGALRRGRCSSAVDEVAAAESMALVRSRADLVYPGHDRPFTLEAGTPGKDLPA